MKKFVKVMLCVGLCLVIAGGLLMGCGMLAGAAPAELVSGGSWNVTIFRSHGDNQWQADNRYLISANAIYSIEIDWLDGDITIEPWDGEEICLEETSSTPITEKNHLVYRIDDDTLEIDFWAERAGISFGGPDLPVKNLKVLVPRQLADRLEEISLDAVSSDVTVKDLGAASVSVDSVSGSLFAENLNVREIALSTVSGNLEGSFRSCPQELEMDSVSGSVEITLPEGSQFQVEMNSVSGEVHSQFPSWSDAGAYFEMDTASGDFIVKKAPGTTGTQPGEGSQQPVETDPTAPGETVEPAQATEPTEAAETTKAVDRGDTI